MSTRNAAGPDGAFATRRLYVQFPRSQEEKGVLFFNREMILNNFVHNDTDLCMVRLYFCFENSFFSF